jgi:hypothetical protein
MKYAGLLLCLAALTTTATAKDKLIVLSDADATGLRGKTVALTLHEKPSFVAMTAGKVTFGLFGVGAMVSAGNSLVRDNHIADPADIVRTNLANEVTSAYGAKLLPPDATPIKVVKPDQVAATHTDADFVLDVRTVAWSYAYYASEWSHYWLGYTVQVQLVDTKTGRQLANAACGAGTKDHANPPTHDQLYVNGAQLTKDILASLSWTCTNTLAKDLLHIPPSNMVAVPPQYVDPLTASAASASATPAVTAVAAPADSPATASSVAPPAANSSVSTPAPAPVAAPAAPNNNSGGN